ncbi:MAG: iron response transcriptional regulator IrrA [Pseudomonadota bacterium]
MRAKIKQNNPQQNQMQALLKNAGLRLTRQRALLAELLFDNTDKHVSAEQLHQMVCTKGEHVALATVYNCLNQFCKTGLLRKIAINKNRTFFDTNIHSHQHFFDERTGHLSDIDGIQIDSSTLPPAPNGKKIGTVEVVVHLIDADS